MRLSDPPAAAPFWMVTLITITIRTARQRDLFMRCGTQTASNTRPALYTLTFLASDTLNPVPAMSNDRNINGGGNPQGTCSPLLEFFDGTTDRLFVGTGAAGATTGANLVTMWNITSRIVSNAATPTAPATNELGGTTAFTIANNSPLPQASSTYFGTLASGARRSLRRRAP